MTGINRRRFLATGAAGIAAATVAPGSRAVDLDTDLRALALSVAEVVPTDCLAEFIVVALSACPKHPRHRQTVAELRAGQTIKAIYGQIAIGGAS